LTPALAALLLAAPQSLPAAPQPATAPATASLPAATARLSGPAEQGGLLRGQLPPGASGPALDGKPVAATPDGRFLIGFGRDAPASATLTFTTADGRSISQSIAIAPRQWRIQSLPTLPPRPVPDAEFEARRPDEVARIAAARALSGPASAGGWQGPFRAPANGPTTGVYGSQRILSGTPMAPHSGLDFAAPPGAVVVAPAAGVVVLADGPFTLEGNLVLLDHGMGLVSAFLHLSRIDVKPGDAIAAGTPIGAVGKTGRATGPHLHWGVTWTDVRIDPALLLKDSTP
jgi:murein DD-endopeptidase MepM/ murein hydrolase activator NlpD